MTYTIAFVDEHGATRAPQTTNRNAAIAVFLFAARRYKNVCLAVSSDRGKQILSELGGRSAWYPW